MHFDVNENSELDEVWQLILDKIGNDAKDICSNSSSFYKTQDGLECSLRKINGDLIGICYREKNRNNGFRWTINKIWLIIYTLIKDLNPLLLNHNKLEFQQLIKSLIIFQSFLKY